MGNTCYLSSIIQVLYHIHDFRNYILNINIPKSNSNILYSLKNIFDDLSINNNLSYIIPEYFINNYDNEIIDVDIQKDAGEFLLDLLDKLENRLSIYESKILIKFFFNVVINTKIKFIDKCSHMDNKNDNFFKIELSIQNKKNIYESLNEDIEDELMQGDETIFCGKSNQYI